MYVNQDAHSDVILAGIHLYYKYLHVYIYIN